MSASALSFRAAVAFAIAGMIWGLVMAISEDHSTLTAHAHLNLLGWVSLFLFGIYYRLHPSLESATAAFAQVWVWIISTIVIAAGVGLLYSGHAVGRPAAALGSFIAFFDMLLFGWLVIRGSGKAIA